MLWVDLLVPQGTPSASATQRTMTSFMRSLMRRQQMLERLRQLQHASLAAQTILSLCTCQVPSSRSRNAHLDDDSCLPQDTLGTSISGRLAKHDTLLERS